MHQDCGNDVQIDSDSQPNSAAAVVSMDVIWKGRQVLRVFFLKPEVLHGWGLSTDTIIEWANVWEDVMLFEETNRIAKADIRVEFSGTNGWLLFPIPSTIIISHIYG